MITIDNKKDFELNSMQSNNKIHIYLVSLPDFSQENHISSFFQILSKQEQEQSLQFITKKLGQNYLVSHGILRCILAWHLNKMPQQISYTINPFGKPKLPDQNPLKFNMSHSKDMAVYAVLSHQNVGIDVEWKNPNICFENFFSDILTDSEQSIFLNSKINHGKKIDSFFDIWTKKESLVKALGKGLSYDVKRIETAQNSTGWYTLENSILYCSNLTFSNEYACAFSVHQDQTRTADLSKPLLTIQALSDCHPIVSAHLQ